MIVEEKGIKTQMKPREVHSEIHYESCVFLLHTIDQQGKRNPFIQIKSTISGRDKIRNWKHFLHLLLGSNRPSFIIIKTKNFKVHHTNEE